MCVCVCVRAGVRVRVCMPFSRPSSLPPSLHLPPPFLTPPFLSSTLTQIVVKSTYDMVIFSNDLLHDIKEFRITVETIDWLLPSLKSRVDRLFEDAISFAKACQST